METTLGRSAERTDQNTAFPAVFLMGNGPILDIRVREIFGSVPSSPFMLPLPGCRLFNISRHRYTYLFAP